MFLTANHEARFKILLPVEQSSVAFGHDGIGESGDDSNTRDMAANRIEDNEILTVGQVSKLLKLHQRTIYKLVRNRIIPGRRVGKKWRFLRSEIMNFLVKRDV
jgi:excisionase family DNA binding protein